MVIDCVSPDPILIKLTVKSSYPNIRKINGIALKQNTKQTEKKIESTSMHGKVVPSGFILVARVFSDILGSALGCHTPGRRRVAVDVSDRDGYADTKKRAGLTPLP